MPTCYYFCPLRCHSCFSLTRFRSTFDSSETPSVTYNSYLLFLLTSSVYSFPSNPTTPITVQSFVITTDQQCSLFLDPTLFHVKVLIRYDFPQGNDLILPPLAPGTMTCCDGPSLTICYR